MSIFFYSYHFAHTHTYFLFFLFVAFVRTYTRFLFFFFFKGEGGCLLVCFSNCLVGRPKLSFLLFS